MSNGERPLRGLSAERGGSTRGGESTSLRRKLVALLLLPVLALATLSVGLVLYWGQEVSREQLMRRVTADLSVAHDVFGRVQRDYTQRLQSLASSYVFSLALAEGDTQRLREQLETMRLTGGFDFLHLTDLNGRRLFASGGKGEHSPLLERAAQSGRPAVGIELMTPAQMDAESAGLAERARFSLLPTPRAAPSEREVEDRGMVMRSLVPVADLNGTSVALLDGGVLVNRNFTLVDAVRDLVYGPGTLAEGSIGAVTVFLDDVRISTNVPLRPGERALGTRVSQVVRDSVLGSGETWVARAFVVNDWYVSAYEPIVDVHGKRIGMLYAGFLEAPYRRAYERALGVSIATLVLVCLLLVLAGWYGARRIFGPIERMAETVRAIQRGGDMRIGELGSRDEVAELAHEFDRMLDLLEQRNAEIRLAAARLESKVADRTRELTEQNRRLEEAVRLLEETREQLLSAEKLAALGELTAGVAHEINNPAAVILGNVEVLREELGDALAPVSTEVDLIIEQVDRIRAIVDKLLRFARPAASTAAVEPVSPRTVIEDTLPLVRHEFKRREVSLSVRHAATGVVHMDGGELQQVLVNLLLNAVQACDPGDHVQVSSRDADDGWVLVSVTDQGRGIEPEQLSRVFDPFFTTRAVGGVGLGLSVSYGLVRAYGGDIRVASRIGEGAAFELRLPRQPQVAARDVVNVRNA